MKVTRSYWLGLGSGLILSAMLTLVITPQQGQAVIQPEPSSVSPEATTPPITKEGIQADTPSTTQPSVSTQLSPDQPNNTQSPTQIERSIIIPNGASSERIADLLVAQGYIKDKASFLAEAHQMEVERQFRAGTFTMTLGLTTEEVIRRLIK